MMSCWIEDAYSRPNFTALRKMLDTYVEEKADYMKVRFSMFPTSQIILDDEIPTEQINDGNEPLI